MVEEVRLLVVQHLHDLPQRMERYDRRRPELFASERFVDRRVQVGRRCHVFQYVEAHYLNLVPHLLHAGLALHHLIRDVVADCLLRHAVRDVDALPFAHLAKLVVVSNLFACKFNLNVT